MGLSLIPFIFATTVVFGQSLIPASCAGLSFCCPIPVGAVSPCGVDLGRGACVQPARVGAFTMPPSWAAPFEQVCQCNDPWYGPDCGRCRGSSCPGSMATVRIRRDWPTLTPEQKSQFIQFLDHIKHERDVYVVHHPNGTWEKVTTYDAFAAVHYLVSINPMHDFAHAGPAFAPWHRLLLILFEDTMQAHGLDPSFGVPYWAWEREGSEKSVFTPDGFGATDPNSHRILDGPLADWTVWYNGSVTAEPILRCLGCNPEIPTLPTMDDAQRTVNLQVYDEFPWNDQARLASFRPGLEGFQRSSASNGATSPGTTHMHAARGQVHAMHNRAHMYLDGTMSDVPRAVGDPTFWVLHSNADRFYALWQQLHPNAQLIPNGYALFGHNAADPAMMIFPLMPLRDGFLSPDTWGYTYDTLAVGGALGNPPSLAFPLGLGLGVGIPALAILCIATVCIIRRVKKQPGAMQI